MYLKTRCHDNDSFCDVVFIMIIFVEETMEESFLKSGLEYCWLNICPLCFDKV